MLIYLDLAVVTAVIITVTVSAHFGGYLTSSMARHWNQSNFYFVRFEIHTEVTMKGLQLLLSLSLSLSL
jgi:hypothetical protein